MLGVLVCEQPIAHGIVRLEWTQRLLGGIIAVVAARDPPVPQVGIAFARLQQQDHIGGRFDLTAIAPTHQRLAQPAGGDGLMEEAAVEGIRPWQPLGLRIENIGLVAEVLLAVIAAGLPEKRIGGAGPDALVLDIGKDSTLPVDAGSLQVILRLSDALAAG